MRTLRFLAAALLAALLQMLGLELVPHFFLAIDLLLLVSILNTLDSGPVGSLLGGSIAGLVQDALTGGLFGLHGFANTLAAWVAFRVRQRLVIAQPLQIGVLLGLAAGLQQVTLVLLGSLMVPGGELPGVGVLGLRMLTTGILGALIYAGARRFGMRFSSWRERRRRRLGIEID